MASYAGLDVPSHQSGTVDGKRSISKRGNVRLRAALYFPAMVAVRYNQPLKENYSRIVEKHPTQKKIGIAAVERKLLLLMYMLWKKNESFKN